MKAGLRAPFGWPSSRLGGPDFSGEVAEQLGLDRRLVEFEEGEQDVLGADVVVSEAERLPEGELSALRDSRSSAAGGSEAVVLWRTDSSGAPSSTRALAASPSGSLTRPRRRWAGVISAFLAAWASLWAAMTAFAASGPPAW
jgi:hypothetical protein